MFSLNGCEATREVPKGAAKKAGKLAGNTRTAVAFDWMHFLAEFSRAKRAQRSTMGKKKCGKLPIRENLVIT